MLLLPIGRGLRKSAAMYITNIAKMQPNKMLMSLFIFLACQNQQWRVKFGIVSLPSFFITPAFLPLVRVGKRRGY
jgi:hypothetical protein